MKGQLIGQIFIYIITIIIVAFILVYGYNAIITFKDKAKQISYIQFKNDLENTIEVILVEFGSVKIKDFSVPENINKICFLRSFPSLPSVISDPEIDKYPIIKDSINSGVNKNIFLVGDIVEESFYAGKIRLKNDASNFVDFNCKPVAANKVNLKIEGQGNHVVIS